jgi:trk system potassium uptake protein
MHTIIVGAGDVGFDVARMLSLQKHNVTVVDLNPQRIAAVGEALDVMTVLGSGTSATVLERAGVRKAELVVAVTDIDEVNLIAAMVAARVGNKPITIARVRTTDLTTTDGVLGMSDFGIDLLIQPEDSTAAEIVALLRRAAASDVIELAGGKLQLIGLRIDAASPVIGVSLEALSRASEHLTFRVMGIVRGGRTIIPRGDAVVQRDDQVFVVVQSGQVAQITHVFGKSGGRLDQIMILGGGRVAAHLVARLLREPSGSQRRHIILVEPDALAAERLAEQFEGVLVIHGEVSDIDLLAREGIGEMDALVAVTPDEETNLVSCLLAKHLGVRKTVALLSKSAYIPISRSIGLDAAVSQKLAVSREVMRYLRGKHVTSVTTILGLDAEVLELSAQANAPVTLRGLAELRLPEGILIAAIVRGDEVMVSTGRSRVRAGDQALIFVLPDMVPEVERLFGHVKS